MHSFLRALIVPYFMAFIPLVWYINRNVMTERLPPYIEPSVGIVLGALFLATIVSLLLGVSIALFRRTDVDELTLPYHQRIIQLDEKSAKIFLGMIGLLLFWSPIGLLGYGPDWLADVLLVLISPLGLPLLLLAPFAIHFHWAVVLGLILTVLWMSLVSILFTDKIVNSRIEKSIQDS